jgi:HK97 family phage major capsid protein
LIDLQTDQLEQWQPNSVFMFHRKIWGEIIKLKDAENRYLINPQLLFAGVDPQLLGKSVRMAGDMPNSYDTDGSIVGLYGDFREGYAIIDRIGIRVLRDPLTTKGVIKYYTTKRSGGGIVNYQCIKRLGVNIDT